MSLLSDIFHLDIYIFHNAYDVIYSIVESSLDEIPPSPAEYQRTQTIIIPKYLRNLAHSWDRKIWLFIVSSISLYAMLSVKC